MTKRRDVHQLLRAWRGDMKLDRASVYLSDRIQRPVSRETIRRYESKVDAPQHLDPLILAGLARVYGRDPAELPSPWRKAVAHLRELFDDDQGDEAKGAYLSSQLALALSA